MLDTAPDMDALDKLFELNSPVWNIDEETSSYFEEPPSSSTQSLNISEEMAADLTNSIEDTETSILNLVSPSPAQIIGNRRRGRPRKSFSESGSSTRYSRINDAKKVVQKAINDIKDKLTELEASIESYKIDLDVAGAKSSVVMNNDMLNENEELRNTFIRRLAKNKIRHLISNQTMQDLLSHRYGVDFSVKAKVIDNYVAAVHDTMSKKIDIQSGELDNTKKYSILNIKQLLEFLFTEIPDYQNIMESQTEFEVRISGDGRSSSRLTDFVLYTLTVLFEQDDSELTDSDSESTPEESNTDTEDEEINYEQKTRAELITLLKNRNLPVNGNKELLIERLKNDDNGISDDTMDDSNDSFEVEMEENQNEEEVDYQKCTCAVLKAMCKNLGLPVSGLKADLINRLKDKSKIHPAVIKAKVEKLKQLIHANKLKRSKQVFSRSQRQLGKELGKLNKKVKKYDTYFNSEDCISIGVMEGAENYEDLSQVFPLLMEQIVEIEENGIVIGEKTLKFTFKFCSDWKFMAIMSGLNAANANYFCLWCLCHKDDRVLFNSTFENIQRDPTKEFGGLCKKCIDGKKHCGGKHGVISPSLFKAPLDNISRFILDALHGRLRIGDIIEEGIMEVVTDNGLEQVLELECLISGIPWKSKKYDATNDSAKWSKTLNGPQKVHLWKTLNVRRLFENVLDNGLVDDWEKLLTAAINIDEMLHCRESHLDEVARNCSCVINSLDDFSSEVKKFALIASNLRNKAIKGCTPYVHSLEHHVPNMMRANGGTISRFSCSAQELQNSLQTMAQFRSSNMHNVPLDLQRRQLALLFLRATTHFDVTIGKATRHPKPDFNKFPEFQHFVSQQVTSPTTME